MKTFLTFRHFYTRPRVANLSLLWGLGFFRLTKFASGQMKVCWGFADWYLISSARLHSACPKSMGHPLQSLEGAYPQLECQFMLQRSYLNLKRNRKIGSSEYEGLLEPCLFYSLIFSSCSCFLNLTWVS